MIEKIIKNETNEIINCLKKIKLNNRQFKNLCKIANLTMQNNGKIIFCGNGGSAADSQHLAAELVVKYQKKRKALPAIAITTDTSILTSIGNDFSYDKIFSRQIEAIGQEKDLIICLTTSGNSKNIINAVKAAKKKKINCFSIVGNNGGKLKKIQSDLILIPSKKTSIIQICQLTLGHILCDYVEKNL